MLSPALGARGFCECEIEAVEQVRPFHFRSGSVPVCLGYSEVHGVHVHALLLPCTLRQRWHSEGYGWYRDIPEAVGTARE